MIFSISKYLVFLIFAFPNAILAEDICIHPLFVDGIITLADGPFPTIEACGVDGAPPYRIGVIERDCGQPKIKDESFLTTVDGPARATCSVPVPIVDPSLVTGTRTTSASMEEDILSASELLPAQSKTSGSPTIANLLPTPLLLTTPETLRIGSGKNLMYPPPLIPISSTRPPPAAIPSHSGTMQGTIVRLPLRPHYGSNPQVNLHNIGSSHRIGSALGSHRIQCPRPEFPSRSYHEHNEPITSNTPPSPPPTSSMPSPRADATSTSNN